MTTTNKSTDVWVVCYAACGATRGVFASEARAQSESDAVNARYATSGVTVSGPLTEVQRWIVQ